MSNFQRWVLTDVASGYWLEQFHVSGGDVPSVPGRDWHITKHTLHGGLREGIDLVELCNGPFAVRVLPTRGAGLWNAVYNGMRLGWDAPIHGPVHPKFVSLPDRGGIGWLAGFDEWLCRCGLSSNGPPGLDGGTALPLHGRIANLPAHHVEVAVNLESPHEILCRCQVEEAGLFLGRLRLTSTVRMALGANRLTIHDVVENLSSGPAEMQLLYHLNFGPPLLQENATVSVPFEEMAPQTPRAAEGIGEHSCYLAPTPGYAEQVYLFRPTSGPTGETCALLTNAAQDRGAAVHWNVRQLPCFTIWKNTIPLSDGYVTGLEPATNYPYFKSHERTHGRVVKLEGGARWEAEWHIDALDSAAAVRGVQQSIASIQAHGKAITHPSPVWAPA